jgi:hypothetical protein
MVPMSDARPDNRPAGANEHRSRPSGKAGCQDLFDIIKEPTNDPKPLRRLPRLVGEALALVWAAGPRVGSWRDRFVDAGEAGIDRSLPGPDGGQSQTERRLRRECEQLKLALAEATVQLRIWQKGSEFVDAVPSPTSKP